MSTTRSYSDPALNGFLMGRDGAQPRSRPFPVRNPLFPRESRRRGLLSAATVLVSAVSLFVASPLAPLGAAEGRTGIVGETCLQVPGSAVLYDASIPLEQTVLSLSERECRSLTGRPFDREKVAAGLSRLSGRVESLLGGERDPHKVLAAIGQVVFREEKFAYDPSGTDPEVYLLDRVLERKRGNCLGLTLLYDLIGERIGFPLTGGYVPGHLFVRYEANGVRINVETSRKGKELPDDSYRRTFRLSGSRPYLQTLGKGELTGVFVKTLGASCSCGGKDVTALRLYEEAKRLYPRLADVYFNTGVSLQHAGRQREAAAEYRQCLLLDPELSVARDNLGLVTNPDGSSCEDGPVGGVVPKTDRNVAVPERSRPHR
jgi:hypothetical protein